MNKEIENIQRKAEVVTVSEKMSKVVSLFEEFRDTGYLKLSDSQPAIVECSEDKKDVLIKFNTTLFNTFSQIKISEINGSLFLNRTKYSPVRELEEDEKMIEITDDNLLELVTQEINFGNFEKSDVENEQVEFDSLIRGR